MTATPLEKLLRSLDAMLLANDVPSIQEAETEIWDYLSAFDGLSAQTKAIDELAAAFQQRPANSPIHEMICHHIAQHKHRLTDI